MANMIKYKLYKIRGYYNILFFNVIPFYSHSKHCSILKESSSFQRQPCILLLQRNHVPQRSHRVLLDIILIGMYIIRVCEALAVADK